MVPGLRGVTGTFLGVAAAQPQQAGGQDGAAHAEVGWEVEVGGLGYEGVPVGTIKRFATGRGNADKAAVIAAMQARGFRPADDNEADALALLLWATSSTGGRA